MYVDIFIRTWIYRGHTYIFIYVPVRISEYISLWLYIRIESRGRLYVNLILV